MQDVDKVTYMGCPLSRTVHIDDDDDDYTTRPAKASVVFADFAQMFWSYQS